jgi:hypothetical protein
MKRRGLGSTGCPKLGAMLPFLRRNKARHPEQVDPELPDVSQPLPLSDPPTRDPAAGMTVSELSELEARALCAREGIPVFWPRPDQDRDKRA